MIFLLTDNLKLWKIKKKSGAGADEVHTATLYYYKKLSFLYDGEIRAATHTTMDENNNELETQEVILLINTQILIISIQNMISIYEAQTFLFISI